MLFDYIDEKNTGVINYMQFYHLIKENCEKYGICSASDLVLNLSMEHSNSARGRKVRQDFKARMTKSDEPRNQPLRQKKSSSPRKKAQEEEELISTPKERRAYMADSKEKSKARRRNRPMTTMDARRVPDSANRTKIGQTLSLRNLGDSFDNSGQLFESKPFRLKSPQVQDEVISISMDDMAVGSSPRPYRTRRSISNPPSLFDIEGQGNEPFYRRESQGSKTSDDGSDDIFNQDDSDKEDEDFNFRREKRPTFDTGISRQPDRDSFEEEMKSIVAETQRSIVDAIAKHKATDVALLSEIKKLLVSQRRAAPNSEHIDDMLAIKDDVQRLAQRISSAELSSLSEEVGHIRQELRQLREEQSQRMEPEIQDSLEGVQEMLARVGSHTGFSLGSKVDQLEAKLSRILTIIVKDKTKGLDRTTKDELHDERRRRNDAVKFIEDQVKKFTQQKADYKNQIRQESDKIRKERRLQLEQKDQLRKAKSSIEKQNVELNDRTHQVKMAQKRRTQSMRRGSMLTANDINKMTGQNDELDRLKEAITKNKEQVLKIKAKGKNERKRYQDALNELRKTKKRLENEKMALQNTLSEAIASRKEDAQRCQELTKERVELEFENDELRVQTGEVQKADLLGKESLEKERTYLAKMKDKLQDLAQKLTEERDSNNVAHDLDHKEKNIGTQQKLLFAERESLYTEREQFDAERAGFQQSRAEQDESLKEREKSIKQVHQKLEEQAKIMETQFPKFQARLAGLEEQEKKSHETAKNLKAEADLVNVKLSEVEKKNEEFQKQADEVSLKEKALVAREKEVNEMRLKVEETRAMLAEKRKILREKQLAFENLTRDFETAAIKKKSKTDDAMIKQVLLEENTKLKMEFAAERQALKKEYQKREASMSDQKTLRKKAKQLIHEDKLTLEHERQRISYLTKELHSTMNDLEKQKIEFEEEKRNWVRVIRETIDDESLVKEIHKMFLLEKNKKDGGVSREELPSPRLSGDEKDDEKSNYSSHKKAKKKNKSRKK